MDYTAGAVARTGLAPSEAPAVSRDGGYLLSLLDFVERPKDSVRVVLMKGDFRHGACCAQTNSRGRVG